MTLLVVLGILGGALTTISGFGGGVLLVVALTFFLGPVPALAISTPALLVGNAHRYALYRRDAQLRIAAPLLIGIVPASLLGSAFAVSVPPAILQTAIIAVTVLAVARAIGKWQWTLPRRALPPAGAAVGLLAASAGGAGVLVGPLLLSTGLSGTAYLGTMAATAVVMHVSRFVGYAAAGLYEGSMVTGACVLALALIAGNLLGDRIRRTMSEPALRLAEYAAPVICVALAVAGVV